jgi:hypothetical protein
MLIGISGKIGSGKDTVGLIIQYLMLKEEKPEYYKDLAFDEVANIENGDDVLDIASSIEIKKYAAKLKQIVAILTGVNTKDLEDQDFKKLPIPGWNMTYRELLQKVGTDAMRDKVLENIWELALFVDYRPGSQRWVITDTRFLNEAEAIKKRKGLVIRVVRNSCSKCKSLSTINVICYKESYVCGLICNDCGHHTDYTLDHASETGLDEYKDFDHVIINDGTIEDLIEKVKNVLILSNFISK